MVVVREIALFKYIYISDGPDLIFLKSAYSDVYADTEILTYLKSHPRGCGYFVKKMFSNKNYKVCAYVCKFIFQWHRPHGRDCTIVPRLNTFVTSIEPLGYECVRYDLCGGVSLYIYIYIIS